MSFFFILGSQTRSVKRIQRVKKKEKKRRKVMLSPDRNLSTTNSLRDVKELN